MTKPIEFFKSNKQFQECAKWWQHKLFLDDWFIKVELTEKEIVEEDNILSGLCEFNFNNKEAKIKIYNTKELESEDAVIRNIAELSLIHELLHLKSEYISEYDISDIENKETFHEYIFHQSLEVMAKSLLMVKYSLDYSYFYGSESL